MFISLLKNFVPKSIKQKRRSLKLNLEKEFVQTLPKLSEQNLIEILTGDLGITRGDTLFVHSSTSYLNLDFEPYKIINILLELIGEKGTIVFPTYPKLSSFDFLKSGEVFNIKRTPTFTGLLNEYARRHTAAKRSLHPTKSCVAIGSDSHEITNEHDKSIYPYDVKSPYYKINQFNAKIIGIGVPTTYLSCVHCVDDFLKESFPVNPYHKKIFTAKCIDYGDKEVFVRTLAHNITKMDFNIPYFMKRNINPLICRDLKIKGYNFFLADSNRLINELLLLAKQGITIYHKRHYKIKYFLSLQNS